MAIKGISYRENDKLDVRAFVFPSLDKAIEAAKGDKSCRKFLDNRDREWLGLGIDRNLDEIKSPAKLPKARSDRKTLAATRVETPKRVRTRNAIGAGEVDAERLLRRDPEPFSGRLRSRTPREEMHIVVDLVMHSNTPVSHVREAATEAVAAAIKARRAGKMVTLWAMVTATGGLKDSKKAYMSAVRIAEPGRAISDRLLARLSHVGVKRAILLPLARAILNGNSSLGYYNDSVKAKRAERFAWLAGVNADSVTFYSPTADYK